MKYKLAGKAAGENSMNVLFFLCGIVTVGFVLCICIYLILSGVPAIGKIGFKDFFLGKVWKPTATTVKPSYGILPFILTSICGTAGAVLIGVPIGLLTAVFLAKVAPPKLADLIRTAVQRMGLTNVEALCNDATKVNPALPQADRILADVPCSGLGILAKKPDLRYKKLEPAREAELLATQSAILDTAAQLLKAGGRLVYSTCTIDPAENQQQIAAFLARHPEFAVVKPAVALPAGMTAGEHGALSVPTRTGMDGFFLCAMQKNG